MVHQKNRIVAVLFALMLLSDKVTLAQQLVVPSLGDPQSNPIAPANLQDAPAFGDSGPVQVEPKARLEEALPAAAIPPAESNAEWKPKFHVELTTLVDVMVTESKAPADDFLQLPEATDKRTIKKIAGEVSPKKLLSVILQCDDINVEANADESSKLTYSFSCKGKAVLQIDGSTITGSSISSSNGVLTISNGVIELGGRAIVTAEKLQLTLPVSGVKVAPAGEQPVQARAGEEGLRPVPDPISNEPFLMEPMEPFSRE